jgi:hypothetical protein
LRQLKSVVHVEVSSIPNYKYISMTNKTICHTVLLARKMVHDSKEDIVQKEMTFETLEQLKFVFC